MINTLDCFRTYLITLNLCEACRGFRKYKKQQKHPTTTSGKLPFLVSLAGMRQQVWSMFTSLTTSRDLDLKVENKVKPLYNGPVLSDHP